ncbi:NADP oxidoreductase [Candidatus Poribacteria bacterium]|nr:NADP oxidoreductase [Candidatus Poribacteria bacterium]
MSKVKLATDWLDVCAGCHMSLLDIDERLVALLDKVEITSTPITDLKHPPKEGVDVGILTGAISNTHQLEAAKEMRERCKILVAIGDCAALNGIPSMRNSFDPEETLKYGYITTISTVDGKIPRSDELGKLFDRSMAIHELVQVEVNLPGCPPSADSIYHVIAELLEGRIPSLSGEFLKYD